MTFYPCLRDIEHHPANACRATLKVMHMQLEKSKYMANRLK